MKKNALVFGIVLIFIFVVLIYNLNNRRTNMTSDSSSSGCPSQEALEKAYDIAICTTESLPENEIVKRLVTEWLQQSTRTNVSDEYQLNDYKVDSIKLMENISSPSGLEQYPFGAQITFSVLPSVDAERSNWIAPDGLLGQNGWIVNKKMYVGVKKLKNGVYQLKQLGQCISC